jgi:kynurenine formamidase
MRPLCRHAGNSSLVSRCAATQPAAAFDVADYRIVDLGHAYGDDTLYWPSRPAAHFQLEQLSHGETPGGYFYAANRFCTAEHGGTHLDAPNHFSREGQTVDALPVERLIGAAVRIDVREQAGRDRSYRLQVDDVLSFEKKHGAIQPGTIVLLQTGWSRYWGDRKAYFGSESEEDASGLDFPSYGAEAARLLIEQRKVALIGVDTASIDYGRSRDFLVHRVAGAANVGGLENLTNLDQLPDDGFSVDCAADEHPRRFRCPAAHHRARAPLNEGDRRGPGARGRGRRMRGFLRKNSRLGRRGRSAIPTWLVGKNADRIVCAIDSRAPLATAPRSAGRGAGA